MNAAACDDSSRISFIPWTSTTLTAMPLSGCFLLLFWRKNWNLRPKFIFLRIHAWNSGNVQQLTLSEQKILLDTSRSRILGDGFQQQTVIKFKESAEITGGGRTSRSQWKWRFSMKCTFHRFWELTIPWTTLWDRKCNRLSQSTCQIHFEEVVFLQKFLFLKISVCQRWYVFKSPQK